MATGALLVDVVRSPRGKANPNGGLAKVTPPALVGHLVRKLVGEPADADVDGLILGCVGQVGPQGGNVALMTKLVAGLPDRAFAFALNNFCVSSLTAIGQAASMVTTGDARRMLAGGVEHMSTVPFLADQATYYTDTTLPERIRYVPAPVAARAVVEAYLKLHQMDPALHKVLLEQVPRVAKLNPMIRVRQAIVDVIRGFLAARRKEIDVDDVDLAAFVIVQATEALIHAAILERPELLKDPRYTDQIVKVILRYLGVRPDK